MVSRSPAEGPLNVPNENLRESKNFSRYLLFNRVIKTACSARTYQEALEFVSRELYLILDGDRVAILLKDPSSRVFRVRAMAGYPEDIKEVAIPVDEEKIKWVTLHQRPLRLNNISARQQGNRITSVGSVLVIPLSFQGENLGVLILESDRKNSYTESDEVLFEILGILLAVININFSLSEMINHQVDREHLSFEITSKIHQSTTVNQVISAAANELGKSLNALSVRINIKAEDSSSSHGNYEYLYNETLVLPDQNINMIDVPIKFHDIDIGSVTLSRSRDWTGEDRKVIETVAINIASAVENVLMLDDIQKAVFRERSLGEISSKIWSSPNIELILQTAIKELGVALKADEAFITLNN